MWEYHLIQWSLSLVFSAFVTDTPVSFYFSSRFFSVSSPGCSSVVHTNTYIAYVQRPPECLRSILNLTWLFNFLIFKGSLCSFSSFSQAETSSHFYYLPLLLTQTSCKFCPFYPLNLFPSTQPTLQPKSPSVLPLGWSSNFHFYLTSIHTWLRVIFLNSHWLFLSLLKNCLKDHVQTSYFVMLILYNLFPVCLPSPISFFFFIFTIYFSAYICNTLNVLWHKLPLLRASSSPQAI